MTATKYDVLGIGNALVDVLARVDEKFISAEGLRRATMQLIDAARAESLYAHMPPATEVSGGSAPNVLAGIASLGGRAAFIGTVVASDQLGEVFRHDLIASGVVFESPAVSTGVPTGRCLSLVTPDAERTMCTFIGAAAALDVRHVDGGMVAGASIVFSDGFMFVNSAENRAACYELFRLASEARRKIAFSLADVFCVEMYRAEFKDLIENHVDILFANEAEICSLYETDFNAALEIVRGKVGIACLTRGAVGSIIIRGAETVMVKAAYCPKVVDTTGAGDLYAAGFLYGYTKGMSLAECGRHAAIAAAEVISHIGARPMVKLSELVKRAA